MKFLTGPICWIPGHTESVIMVHLIMCILLVRYDLTVPLVTKSEFL